MLSSFPSQRPAPPGLAIVGGGPAGLMAAEAALAAGLGVDLYERKGSVGRKFLLAGKGGLNLTHSEGQADVIGRYGPRADAVGDWLIDFGPERLRDWAAGLGIPTFVGSSGRVFPTDQKAAPLLRVWLRRLRESGLRLHTRHLCLGIAAAPAGGFDLHFETPEGRRIEHSAAVLLALGGASWPQLGSDGSWQPWVAGLGAGIAPLEPANCGFERTWSTLLVERYAGAPIKPVVLHWTGADGRPRARQGELILTEHGLEGGLLYAAAADLRHALRSGGEARIALDLAPGRDEAEIARVLAQPRGKRSLSEQLRRALGLSGVRAALLHEDLTAEERAALGAPAALAERIKRLPLRLKATRPLAEAISTAGGVRLQDLNRGLMLRSTPGVFLAGEMLDWEAPTGGYLLTACFASGYRAGRSAADWLVSCRRSSSTMDS